MVWKYASNKFKKNYSTFYHGSIIGDWLEPFVFTVSSKSLRRTVVLTYSSNFRRSFARVLDRYSISLFSTDLSIFPSLSSSEPRSLISTRFPSFFLWREAGLVPSASPRWYIFSTLASISRHFITIKRARHALSPCCIMAIHQRVVLPASIAIQIGANPRWLSLLMTLKSWRGCSVFRTFDRGVIKCVVHDLSNNTYARFCFINLNVTVIYYCDILENVKLKFCINFLEI